MAGPGLGVAGLGLGAALMYWMDPRSGRRRRHLLGDKAVHAVHKAEGAVERTARDLAQRSRGRLHDTMARLNGEPVDDHVLVERVRSALGRVCSHPHGVTVRATSGTVRLEGAILSAEHRRVISRVKKVPGVKAVEDALEPHEQAENVPSLQGGMPRRGDLPELLQRNWSPAIRLGAGLGGLQVAWFGRRLGGPIGLVTSLGGLVLLARSLTNLDLRRLTGLGAGRQAIVFHKDIHVEAPVEEVFAYFCALDRFPRFMSHVEEVSWLPENRTRWRVRGPAGIAFEWEAEITERIPNRKLSWRSIQGSTVQTSGAVNFEEVPGGGTRLDVRLAYNPPGGALGHLFARAFGSDPKRLMDDDLLRFKSLMEKGKATGHETVTREALGIFPTQQGQA